MACTELFGVITVSFEFNRYEEHILEHFGLFDRKTTCVVFLLLKLVT